MAGWQDLGEVAVRVNVSAHELRSRTYVDQVGEILAETGLDPTLLGIEITESVLVDEDKVTQDNLTRLRDSGITLLIDDFGTGYSSLSYLQRFPVVDVLKVDRSFLGAGTRGEAVVQAVVGLGEAFDLQVCAEGVETPEQHARVVELGCDFAQGYLLGRPVPGSEVRELLAGWRPLLLPRLAEDLDGEDRDVVVGLAGHHLPVHVPQTSSASGRSRPASATAHSRSSPTEMFSPRRSTRPSVNSSTTDPGCSSTSRSVRASSSSRPEQEVVPLQELGGALGVQHDRRRVAAV